MTVKELMAELIRVPDMNAQVYIIEWDHDLGAAAYVPLAIACIVENSDIEDISYRDEIEKNSVVLTT